MALSGRWHGTLRSEARSKERGQTPNQQPQGWPRLQRGVVPSGNVGRAIFDNCIGTLCDLVRKVKSLYNYIGFLEFPVGMYYWNLGRKSKQENAIMATQLPTRPLGAIRGQWPTSRASAWLMQQFSKMRNLLEMKICKGQGTTELKDSLGNGNSS